jgi:tetratricopeptide (TPR) repeat protein
MDAKALFQKAAPYLFALVVFYMLLSCVPASVYSGDDGETVTASYTLGIQHPPGYPLFSLLGRIFSYVPLGEPAFRVCLMSVFLAALNFLLIYFFFSRLLSAAGIKDFPVIFALLPSLIYSAGFTVFQQSIIAKGGIYTLNNSFTILISMILLEMSLAPAENKWLYLFVFIFGLSLGNHLMIEIITLPAYVFAVVVSGALKGKKPAAYAAAGLFFACAIFVYYYLPVRAGTALLNWGDPSSLENFFQVITRWQYVGSEIAKSVSGAFGQFLKFFTSTGYASLWAGLALSVFGAYFLIKRRRDLAFYLLLIPALSLLAVTFYLNLPKDRIYIMETYITPVYFPLSILCGLGLYYISKKASELLKTGAFTVAAALGLALFAAQAVYFYPKMDKSRYFFAYDYNRNLLDSVEQDSILFLTGDGVVFPCWYLQYVKKYRPDVSIVGTAVLPMEWVRNGIKRHNPAIQMPHIKTKKIGTESTGYIIDAIIRMNFSKFNLYFSYNKPEENALDKNLSLLPKGMIFKVIPAPYAYVSDKLLVSNNALWQFYNLRCVDPQFKKYSDDKSRSIYVSDYAVSLNQTGTFLEDNLFYGLSLDYFRRASRVNPDDHEFVYNIGNAYYNLKNYAPAISQYRKSVEMKPDYENGWFNMGVAYYTVKNYPEAIKAFEQVLKINPSRQEVAANISLIKGLMGAGK